MAEVMGGDAGINNILIRYKLKKTLRGLFGFGETV